ncbi:MAG: glycosyltransferase [Deltaproteobacteria bacterium]|nr:glycosyltransferase [Deltaproteobacteria bacterium]
MRWVILSDDFSPLDGGIATWAAAVAGGLHAAGHEVLVFARSRDRLGLDEAGRPLPYEVVPVRGPSFGRLGGWWVAAAAWSRLRKGDMVLATTWNLATHLVGRMRWLGVPLQVAFHGSDLTRSPADARGFRRVCRYAERRWTMSAYLAGVLQGRGFQADRLAVPIDAAPPSERRLPKRPSHWGFVGRATALKGGDRFVRLVAAARVRGTVIGDGPALEAWRALAQRLGAADRMRFTGRLPRAEVLRCLPDLDLALLLPRTDVDGGGAEGLGLALIEAAAAGVATVGCRTGGVPEAVGSGLLLEDPDDVSASLLAIEGWWTTERGRACRDWVAERCGVTHTVRAIVTGRATPLPGCAPGTPTRP